MLDVKKLADEAEVIVQGYVFIPKGEGITIIDLHKPEHAAYFYNDEIVETSMDEIEAFKVTKLYRNNVKYMESAKFFVKANGDTELMKKGTLSDIEVRKISAFIQDHYLEMHDLWLKWSDNDYYRGM